MSTEESANITSTRNRWIRLARSLHRRKSRYQERAMLVEGIRPLRELLAANLEIRAVLISHDVIDSPEIQEIQDVCRQRAEVVATVTPGVLDQAADTESPQGILAITTMPDWSGFSLEIADPLILIVDRVRDPGNLGTLIRSARGSGCSAVLIGSDSVDPFSPKVIRSSAGSVLHLPVITFGWDHPPDFLAGLSTYVTTADAERSYDEVDWSQGSAIIIGNETAGVSNEAFSHADGRVGIPLANSLESLNAGVAGSVILFEAWRQRKRR